MALAVILTAAPLGGCAYDEIQELDELARAARSDIEIQLQRRAQLVPNLIATLSAHTTITEETIASVSDARAELYSAVRSGELHAMQESSAKLWTGIATLLNTVSRSADLETDPVFKVLQAQLDGTEAKIRSAERAYNEAVLRHNEYIRTFPQLVTAKIIGAKELETFDYMDETPVVAPAQ